MLAEKQGKADKYMNWSGCNKTPPAVEQTRTDSWRCIGAMSLSAESLADLLASRSSSVAWDLQD